MYYLPFLIASLNNTIPLPHYLYYLPCKNALFLARNIQYMYWDNKIVTYVLIKVTCPINKRHGTLVGQRRNHLTLIPQSSLPSTDCHAFNII
jgi:hypothetical protein